MFWNGIYAEGVDLWWLTQPANGKEGLQSFWLDFRMKRSSALVRALQLCRA